MIGTGSPYSALGAVAWRQRVLILAVTALVTVGAFGWALAQPTVYAASSRILLTTLSAKTLKALGTAGGSGGIETLSTQTQAQLIGNSEVAARVSEAIHGRLSTEELARAVDARVVGDNLIEIRAVGSTPVLAQAEANAFADAYLAYRSAAAAEDVAAITEQIAGQRAGLEARAAEAEQAIEQASASLAQLPPVELSDAAQTSTREALTTDQAQATAERTRLMASIRDLNVQQADLAGATGSPGEVVTRAPLPTSPAGPGVLVVGLAGVLGGVMLGMVAALVRDRLGERVGSDEDAWADGAPPPLRVPRDEASSGSSGSGGSAHAGLALANGGNGETAEFYRHLRETLIARGLGERHRILLVTSPGRREGKSATAANLAVALAQSGLSTIAVSADLRRPRLGALLGADGQPGLTDVLKGTTKPSAALRSSGIPNLRVLPTAPERATGSDLLASPALGRLLRSLIDECDVVVVDAAGVADGADAAILAGLCGASLLVVKDGVTLAGAASRAVQALARAGAPPLGTIVSPAPPTSAPVRVAVAGLGAATVLLGSVVWASTASVRGTPDTDLAVGSAVPAQQGAAIVPNTGPPRLPDLDDPAVKAELKAKVAPLVAAAPDKTSAATPGKQALTTPGRDGKPAGGRSGKAAQAAGGPGAPAAAPGNPAAAPAPAVVPPVPGPGSVPLPPPVTSPAPDPSPSRSRRPRSPTPRPTRTPDPTPSDSPSRRPRPPSPTPTVQPSPPRPTPPRPSPTATQTRPPRPPSPTPPRPSPTRPDPSPSATDDPTPPWWWPWPRPRPSPTPTRQPPPRPSPAPSPSDSGPGSGSGSGSGGSGGGSGPGPSYTSPAPSPPQATQSPSPDPDPPGPGNGSSPGNGGSPPDSGSGSSGSGGGTGPGAPPVSPSP